MQAEEDRLGVGGSVIVVSETKRVEPRELVDVSRLVREAGKDGEPFVWRPQGFDGQNVLLSSRLTNLGDHLVAEALHGVNA